MLQELSKCKVMLEEGGKREEEGGRREEGGGRRKERGGRRNRQGGKKEETGREGEWRKLIHRAQRERDWLEKQFHKVFPKLPVEGKGVWPRLVRWNGVTPGRQCTCWCEAVWDGEGDGVGEVPALLPCEHD